MVPSCLVMHLGGVMKIVKGRERRLFGPLEGIGKERLGVRGVHLETKQQQKQKQQQGRKGRNIGALSIFGSPYLVGNIWNHFLTISNILIF